MSVERHSSGPWQATSVWKSGICRRLPTYCLIDFPNAPQRFDLIRYRDLTCGLSVIDLHDSPSFLAPSELYSSRLAHSILVTSAINSCTIEERALKDSAYVEHGTGVQQSYIKTPCPWSSV